MPKTTRWKDIPGSLTIQVDADPDGSLFAPEFDEWLPIRVSPLPADYCNDSASVVIHFRSTGYCAPGTYEHPPEHGEERTLESAWLEWEAAEHGGFTTRRVQIKSPDAETLFDTYPDKIDAVELTVEQ